MSNSIELKYDRVPRVGPSYARALTGLLARSRLEQAVPSITACVNAIQADPQRLRDYRRVCAYAQTDILPVTYPHVLAFPLQLAVMTHKRFPLKLPGLVHVRNEITQHRAVDQTEVLDLTVRVGGQREARRGVEFDLVTELTDTGGHMVWEETSTMLSRRGPAGRKAGAQRPAHDFDGDAGHQLQLHVGADIGRRYAAVAGDCNPIHLSAPSARLFGFRRAIATGMWLKARVAAELEPQLHGSAYKLSVRFKKPVFLPTAVSLRYTLADTGAAFALLGSDQESVHLQGDVSYRRV